MPLRNPTDDVPLHLRERVMADIPRDVFEYFFSTSRPCVFTGVRGARQALTAQFFIALRDACILDGVPQQWEPDNASRVQAIMDRMNFTTSKVAKPRKPKSK